MPWVPLGRGGGGSPRSVIRLHVRSYYCCSLHPELVDSSLKVSFRIVSSSN